jgi:hypothetical protein
VRIAVDAVVDATPHVTFATATDIGAWPQIISAIQAVDMLTCGPMAVGTRFRETRLMFGRQATEEMTVAELDPPRRFVLTAFNHGTAYRAEHVFEPEDAGTRMTLAFEGRPTTLLARLFTPLGLLFLGTLKRQLEADLADLKREAERRGRQPASP